MFKLHTKIKLLLSLGAFFLLFLAGGCKQDSIFDYIAGETAPTQPRIKGSASKMVKATIGAKEKLYIANGRLWEYEYDSSDPAAARWERSSGPGGYVVDVTFTTDGVLYALTIDNTFTRVWKTSNGIDWTQITPLGNYDFIQNIFGAGDTLFAAGANRTGDDNNYAILYYTQQNSVFTLLRETGSSFLTGAGKVGTYYYLATLGSGIFKVSSVDFAVAPVTEASIPGQSATFSIPGDIAGFLQEEGTDTVIGISRGGYIFYIDPSIASSDHVQSSGASLGGTYTGALALMDNPASQGFDKLLLLGYRGTNSSYRHGYMEVLFNSTNGTHEGTRIPGENQPSSIKDEDRKDQQYTSSLRRYPVTALWVLRNTTDSKSPLIFAATSNKGVYSYRNRSDGGWQWNYEE